MPTLTKVSRIETAAVEGKVEAVGASDEKLENELPAAVRANTLIGRERASKAATFESTEDDAFKLSSPGLPVSVFSVLATLSRVPSSTLGMLRAAKR